MPETATRLPDLKALAKRVHRNAAAKAQAEAARDAAILAWADAGRTRDQIKAETGLSLPRIQQVLKNQRQRITQP